jgi:ATP-dependent Zn protease
MYIFGGSDMPEKKAPPKKPLYYYYILALAIILLINTVIVPTFFSPQVKEISYGNFLQMVDDGKVAKVEITNNKIAVLAKDSDNKVIYVTGRVEDPDLVNRLMKSKVEFSQVIPKENSPLVNFFMNWVLPIMIFFALGQLFMRYMGSKLGGGNAMSFGKSNAKVYVEAQTGKSFADVAGQDEAKEALMELVDFLHNPAKYQAIGANMPKGALLVGPPGTGKTLLAKAVAGEAKVPFFSISGSEFIEMFVGMGAARVRDLFKQAQEKAPCIVFIDEIDAIGKRRDSGQFGGNDEREQTLNQLLSEMDGFDGSKGVVILAATNRPESLDKALLRPGRFDRRIPVELPDLQGREAILKVHAKAIKTCDDIDYLTVARATAGASGAELANIVNEAALRAVKMNRTCVSQSDLEESVEVVIAGYQRKGAVIPPEEKKIVENAISELQNKLETTDCTEELKFTPKDILLKRDIDFINKIKLDKEYQERNKTWKDYTRQEQADLIMKYVDDIELALVGKEVVVKQINFRESICKPCQELYDDGYIDTTKPMILGNVLGSVRFSNYLPEEEVGEIIMRLRQYYDVGYTEATYYVDKQMFYFNFAEDNSAIVRVFPLEDYYKLDPDNKMETYEFGIIYIREEDKFQMKEIDTAFDYIPDESNDSVIYTKEPTPISVGVKPVKFCEEDIEETN